MTSQLTFFNFFCKALFKVSFKPYKTLLAWYFDPKIKIHFVFVFVACKYFFLFENHRHQQNVLYFYQNIMIKKWAVWHIPRAELPLSKVDSSQSKAFQIFFNLATCFFIYWKWSKYSRENTILSKDSMSTSNKVKRKERKWIGLENMRFNLWHWLSACLYSGSSIKYVWELKGYNSVKIK